MQQVKMLFTAFWVDDDFNLLDSRATKWYSNQAEAIREAHKRRPMGDVFLVTSQLPNPTTEYGAVWFGEHSGNRYIIAKTRQWYETLEEALKAADKLAPDIVDSHSGPHLGIIEKCVEVKRWCCIQ